MDPELARALEVAHLKALDTAHKIEAFFSCVCQQQWLPQVDGLSPFDNILEVEDDLYDVLGAICLFEQLRRDRVLSLEAWDDDAFESFTAWQWFASSNPQPIFGFGISAGSHHHLVSALRVQIISEVWSILSIHSRFDLDREANWVHMVPLEELLSAFEKLVIWGTLGARPLSNARNLWLELSEEHDRTITLLLQFPTMGLRGRQPEGENHVRISAADRTKPMTLGEAAKHLGRVGSKKDCAEWLRNCIKEGTIRCESIGRQSHVFDRNQFPETAWPKLLPNKTSESGPKSP